MPAAAYPSAFELHNSEGSGLCCLAVTCCFPCIATIKADESQDCTAQHDMSPYCIVQDSIAAVNVNAYQLHSLAQGVIVHVMYMPATCTVGMLQNEVSLWGHLLS
jgi:hypothetical protein